MMPAYGWELGALEAICAVLVVGFAVDYTVHFGIAYAERVAADDGKYGLGCSRGDRVRHAFLELGGSVFGGGITTAGASIILFFCMSAFFKIFGTFMCTVVVVSELFAHFFFMPLLALAGPTGTRGDFGPTREAVHAPRRRVSASTPGGASSSPECDACECASPTIPV